MEATQDSLKRTARLAGLFWLLTGATAAFSLVYLRSKLIVFNDATQTAANILSSESLFRAGIGAHLLSQVFLLFLALTLYRLFRDVNKRHTRLMVTFLVMSATVGVINTFNNVAAVTVLGNADYLAVFQQDERNALMMIFLRLNNAGLGIAEIFTGLSFFAIGMLIIRSGFIPKILGIFLIIACLGFVLNSFTALVFPQYHSSILTRIAMVFSGLGVLPTIVWLLAKGVMSERSERV